MSYRSEADILTDLRELHTADERRARHQLNRELVPLRSRLRTRPNTLFSSGVSLLVVAGVALALLLPRFATQSGASSTAGATELSTTATQSASLASALAEPAASSSETAFPPTVEGRHVLLGRAALGQMQASPSDWYLVGGWVRIMMVDGYSYSGTNVLFFLTNPEATSAAAANVVRLEGPNVLQIPQDRPVVLEVQLDLSCNDQQGPCPFFMVKRVVWPQT